MPRFIPNRGFERQMEREIRFIGGLKEAADEAGEAAKRIAKAEVYDEGDYHDSIESVVLGGEVYLRSTDYKAGWIEMGKANFPILAPLRRGVRAAGLKLREE